MNSVFLYLCFIIAIEKYERSTASSCLNEEVEPRVGLLYLCICVFVFVYQVPKWKMWRKTLTVNLLAPAWTTKWNWGSEDSVGVGERQWGPLAHIHILDKDLIPLLFNTVMSYLNLHNSLVMPTSVYPASHHQLFELCGIVQELILSTYGRVWLKKNSLEIWKQICHIDNGNRCVPYSRTTCSFHFLRNQNRTIMLADGLAFISPPPGWGERLLSHLSPINPQTGSQT